MQERQITVEGETFALDPPFHVIATANPVEYEGTYPLPEAQLDRFLLRISLGYPSPDEEWEVLGRRMARQQEAQELRTVVDAPTLLAMHAAVETVVVDDTAATASSWRSPPGGTRFDDRRLAAGALVLLCARPRGHRRPRLRHARRREGCGAISAPSSDHGQARAVAEQDIGRQHHA
jgi:MoxR-like ATPase